MKFRVSLLVIVLILTGSITFAQDSNAAKALNRSGVERLRQGDLDGAIEDYTKAIEVEPSNAFAYLNRGSARKQKNDVDGAISDYSMAVKHKPDFAPAYISRGGALLLQGKDDEAQKDFEKALKLDPNMKSSIEIQIKQAKEARAAGNQ